jgi:uncharacterized membrane protein YgcG
MITALLLPLLLAAGPAGGAVRADRAVGGDDPAIQLWINNDRTFLQGDRAKVQVRAREDGYLVVLHVQPDGTLRVLFPLDPNDDNFVRGGKKYEIRGRGGRESFAVDGRSGRGTVYAAVSGSPFHFDQFVLGDHWDYRGMAPQRLPSDPEQDLNELVRRMADASFDYDILTYNVVERVVYADDYSTPYYSGYSGYYGGCGYSYYGCGRGYFGSPYNVSVGLFFGRPARRFFYDPFYDPFFFDPFYYRPVYIYPVRNYGYPYGYRYFGSPYYNYPYYGGRYYGTGYRGWNQPYTPYRFRPADGVQAGYRSRGFDLRRSVNTVYLPPMVRDRQPAVQNPVRRVTDPTPRVEPRPVEARPSTAPDRRSNSPAPEPGAGRRSTGAERTPDRASPPSDRGTSRRAESRTVQPNIEARRAREPDQPRTVVPSSPERQNLPVEVRPSGRSDEAPRRAVVDRPQDVRGTDSRPAPAVDARPSRGEDDGYSRPAPRAEPRSEPAPQARPEPRPDRGSYSPPSRSDGGSRGDSRSGWSGGGDRGGGGAVGGDMSGGRRR